MEIIVALLAIIASCLLFGPHATIVMIVLFAAVALLAAVVRRIREWYEDAASRRAHWRQVNQAFVKELEARHGERPKAVWRMSKEERRIAWISAAAILLIMVCASFGS